MRGRLPRELAKLTRDLGLDVERLLAARHPAGVAGLDQRADLLEDLGVGDVIPPARRPDQLGQLGLDVPGGLAAGGTASVARLEHLADLVVALRLAHRRRCGPARPARAHVAVLADREPAAADVVVHAPAPEQ